MSSSCRERGELLVPVKDRDGRGVPPLTCPLSTSVMPLAATTLLGTEPFPAHAVLGTCSGPHILHIHLPRTGHRLPCFRPLMTAVSHSTVGPCTASTTANSPVMVTPL